jgi:peptidoglycan/xylan/chitin deacetylase (PgdA/CDA1 family)
VSERGQSTLSVPVTLLEQHLTSLRTRGYRGLCLSEMASAPQRQRTVVITFDDAYLSVQLLALPLLKAFGFPGTVFAPTEFIANGGVAGWPEMDYHRRDGAPEEFDLMSWEDLRALQAEGWEVGSHTRTHPHLTELDDETLSQELVESKRDCEQQLGRTCRTLAYPFGETDTRVMAATEAAGYRAAVGLPSRMFHAPLTFNWPRVGVYGVDAPWRFALKTSRTVRRLRTLAHEPQGSPHNRPAFLPAAAPQVCGPRTRVAVIIPCFNDGELVTEALESIQEREPIETVIVDDASTDRGTIDVLDRLRADGVNVIRHDHNRGLSAARTTGLRATSAEYVFPLDSDDLAVADALAGMADVLDAHPEAAACFGDYLEFGTRNRVRRVPPRLDSYRILYRNDYLVSSLFRRSVLESVGGWLAVGNLVGYEDWNLWMTLAEREAIGLHWKQGVAVRRRLHGSRMLRDAARQHITLYLTLRTLHPTLFASGRANRRKTDLGIIQRWLYPILFGWRPPLSLRTWAEERLARFR